MDKQKAQCKRKRTYNTRMAAIFFAEADGLRAYRCPVCNKWHLTSQQINKKTQNKDYQ